MTRTNKKSNKTVIKNFYYYNFFLFWIWMIIETILNLIFFSRHQYRLNVIVPCYYFIAVTCLTLIKLYNYTMSWWYQQKKNIFQTMYQLTFKEYGIDMTKFEVIIRVNRMIALEQITKKKSLLFYTWTYTNSNSLVRYFWCEYHCCIALDRNSFYAACIVIKWLRLFIKFTEENVHFAVAHHTIRWTTGIEDWQTT
jgi:hypothetical protein